ncbi:MAG: aspartate kinase [Eubacteriaceae bacterium]|nr:aspartate kinase [Eubacteriaceae bacterium]
MKTIVQKYGGTSVKDKAKRDNIIANAKSAISEGLSPIIVVSAMGRFPDPYSTDALISLLPEPTRANARSKDFLSSVGELVTTVIVAEEFRLAGLSAAPLTGGQAGILTDGTFGEGKIMSIDTTRLTSLLEEGVIPIVAGFQGITEGGDITTLGRGGSDITATALGGAMGSELVEIFTDVDGIMTADPNVVTDAKLINMIEFEDVYRLAEYGAKVIHPRAVEHAMKASVPVKILNVDSSRNDTYTLISDPCDIPMGEVAFTAVTQLDNCSQATVFSEDMAKDDEMYRVLTANNISIDMINILPDRKVFIFNSSLSETIRELFASLGLEAQVVDGFSKITVMANNMMGTPGIVAQIIAALYGNGIFIYQSSDSSTTISVLVKTEDSKTAVQVLHERLISSKNN